MIREISQPQQIMPSAIPQGDPIRLHSIQSAMDLLHPIPAALMITAWDRPGMYP